MWYLMSTVDLEHHLYLFSTEDKARTAFRDMLRENDELTDEEMTASTKPYSFYSHVDKSLITWGECPNVE